MAEGNGISCIGVKIKQMNVGGLGRFFCCLQTMPDTVFRNTLSEKFEKMLQKYSGNLMRSAVELAELWRNDKLPRKLEAMMIVASEEGMYLVDGTGNVIEPDDVCAIGSGGNYALSAARALLRNTDMTAKQVAEESLRIAGEICIFTNDHITVEEV